MSARAAVVLGVFLMLAALLHGGVYEAGHDFVMNRFTGTYEFVPSDDDAMWNVPARTSLTCSGADDRLSGLRRRR